MRRRDTQRQATSDGDAADKDVLLVGLSTRALSDAALRSGFRPRTVDFFGDLDHKRRVDNVALGRDLGLPWSAPEAARVAGSLPSPRVAYAFDLENEPAAVERLAKGRELLGNPPHVLRAVRDPAALFRVLDEAAFPTPVTLFPESGSPAVTAERAAGYAASIGRWLLKPRRGGGGRGVSEVEPGRSPGTDEVLQELVEGPVVGLSFLADGERVRPIGLATQLEERDGFGAAPFAYAGSFSGLPPGLEEASLCEQALSAAQAVTRAFALRGWNGMDFIVRNGELVPLEVNPRHTSSMDLWDAAGVRLFAAHVEACRGWVEGTWLPAPPEVRGKAILFARRSVVVREDLIQLAERRAPATRGEGGRWPESALADVPHPGERIVRGRPVCSLYAAGSSAQDCLTGLRALAAEVERHLDADERGVDADHRPLGGDQRHRDEGGPPHRASTRPCPGRE